MVVTEELQRDSWTRLGSDLPQRGESAVSVYSAVSLVGGLASAFLSGADECADFVVVLPLWWYTGHSCW